MRIHISEGDRFHGKPLYEAIVDKCRELKIAGATVLRGLEGYGETADMHRAGLVGGNLPLVVIIVDTGENLAPLIPAVKAMMTTGIIATSDVKACRLQKD